jgi:hypothetical protein
MEAVVLYFYRLVFETALLTKGTIEYIVHRAESRHQSCQIILFYR